MPTNIDTYLGLGWINPDWPAPSWIKAGTTTRVGGVSSPPYDSLNFGDHVGDDPEAVDKNRALFRKARSLPTEPIWLQQVHGIDVVDAASAHGVPIADASYTTMANTVCVVMTADCLPVLLCDEKGHQVAAIHAGWRGLADGVIEATVEKTNCSGTEILAWLGPAIGPEVFEVGDEVRQVFLDHGAEAESAFKPSPQGRWLANLYTLAQQRLKALGVEKIYGGHWCTHSDQERFYSFRRDGVTGRMASYIWIEH